MEISDQFCLKWNDFHSNVSTSFRNLRKEGEFYDVTLVGDDCKQISAHKVVLSSSSEYFKNILKQNKHSHPLLCLEGISFGELNHVLDYLYHGEVNMHQDVLDRFLNIAKRLKLEGLGQDAMEESEVESYDGNSDSLEGEYKNEGIVKNNQMKTIEPKHEKTLILSSEEFKSVEELDAKILEMLESKNGKWACKVCGKVGTKSHMKEHVEIHFDSLSFSCPKCDLIVKTRNYLRIHIYNKHDKIKTEATLGDFKLKYH